MLETADTIDKNAIWTSVTNGVVTYGTMCYFTNTTPAKSVGFFRLRK
jgi:hypothetical protein